MFSIYFHYELNNESMFDSFIEIEEIFVKGMFLFISSFVSIYIIFNILIIYIFCKYFIVMEKYK